LIGEEVQAVFEQKYEIGQFVKYGVTHTGHIRKFFPDKGVYNIERDMGKFFKGTKVDYMVKEDNIKAFEEE
jgi:hypothetical protein